MLAAEVDILQTATGIFHTSSFLSMNSIKPCDTFKTNEFQLAKADMDYSPLSPRRFMPNAIGLSLRLFAVLPGTE